MFKRGMLSPAVKNIAAFFLSGRETALTASAAKKMRTSHARKKSPSFFVQAAIPASKPDSRNKGFSRARTAARSMPPDAVIKKHKGMSAYWVRPQNRYAPATQK